MKAQNTLEKIKKECRLKEDWRNLLIQKSCAEEKKFKKIQEKASSVHNEMPLPINDFLNRNSFQTNLFIKAKKQVIKKRKEILEKYKKEVLTKEMNSIEKIVMRNKAKRETIKLDSKPKFKLDLTKLKNIEQDHFISNNYISTNTKTKSDNKKSATSRFSYLFHEGELNSQERLYSGILPEKLRTMNEIKSINSLKSGEIEEAKRNMNSFKGKFERALEKLKIRKDNMMNHSLNSEKHIENDSGLNKNRLNKFIQMMFSSYKKKRIGDQDKTNEIKKTDSIKNLTLQAETASHIYLYNNSFQFENKVKKSLSIEENRFLNIHVEKKRRKNCLKGHRTFRDLNFFKKRANQSNEVCGQNTE